MQRAGEWSWSGGSGVEYQTTHYLLRTTVTDVQTVERFARLLESALKEYHALIPGLPESKRPLIVYLFARHDEWASYTVETAGDNADLYLQVYAGGYTVRDRFVCWIGNEPDTLSLTAHEGFHQFVGRHFLLRLPPALEEGLATTFEHVTITGSGATFATDTNHRRRTALRYAVEGNYLIPLSTLVQLHAGDLIDRPVALREGFYAQCWALACFLRDDSRYAARFRQYLLDTAQGNLAQDVGRADGTSVYHPARVQPVLEKALAAPWTEIEAAYLRHLKTLINTDVD